MKTQLSWSWFDDACLSLAAKLRHRRFEDIYGIPRGGLIVAARLSYILDIPLVTDKADIVQRTLVVDDVSDSGGTLKDLFLYLGFLELPVTATLHVNPLTGFVPMFSFENKPEGWVTYPWETGALTDTVSKVQP